MPSPRHPHLLPPSSTAPGVFISIGRGLAVDEEALATALENKSIAGAAVDVFKTEPLPQESRLWQCENALITSHNADFTDDYFTLGCVRLPWHVYELIPPPSRFRTQN